MAERVTPLQISILSPMQLADKNTEVFGIRFNLFYGVNRRMSGIDLGLFNVTEKNSGGVAAGFGNFTGDSHVGIQAGVVNVVSKELQGFQVGVVNYSKKPYGFQIGGINITGQTYLPMFGALANSSDESYLGQISAGLNFSKESPYQFAGILNGSRKGYLQIAVGINYVDEGLFQIAGIYNSAGYHKPIYLQMALGVNSASQRSFLQVAGIWNFSKEPSIQIALIGNSSSSSSFLQLALLANQAKEKSTFQISALSNFGNQSKLQFSTILNYRNCNKPECLAGSQIAVLSNYAIRTSFQFGLINWAENANVQIGGFNQSDEVRSQIGILNRSAKTEGFMIGLFNESRDLTGFQIGLLNVAKNGIFPIMLFYNSNYEKNPSKNFSGIVNSSWSPFQLSIFSPLQIFSQETSIYGLRLNFLYGRNDRIYGLDFGFFNHTSETKGISVGAFNKIENGAAGLQIGLYNDVMEDFYGLQIGVGQYNRKFFYGFSMAAIAITGEDVNGMQIGFLLNSGKNFLLPQFGLGLNFADSSPGQLAGIGNYSKKGVHGPQISGGFNIAHGDVYGQLGGLLNYATGDAIPGQISLLFNGSKFAPFQLTALGNYAAGKAFLQIAGIFNVMTSDYSIRDGKNSFLQASLLLNYSSGAYGTYVQTSIVNINGGRDGIKGASSIVQLGGINFNKAGHFQTGGINVSFGMQGAQLGAVNVLGDNGYGVQFGVVNIAADDFSGVSIGLWNLVLDRQNGLSIGLFNYAKKLNGLQVGLINVHSEGTVPLMLGANIGIQENKSDNSK